MTEEVESKILHLYQHTLALLQVLSTLCVALRHRLVALRDNAAASLDDHRTCSLQLETVLREMQSLSLSGDRTGAADGSTPTLYSYVNISGVENVRSQCTAHINECVATVTLMDKLLQQHDEALARFRARVSDIPADEAPGCENVAVVCGLAEKIPDAVDGAVVSLREPRNCTLEHRAVLSISVVVAAAVEEVSITGNALRSFVHRHHSHHPVAAEMRALTQWYTQTVSAFRAWEEERRRRKEMCAEVRRIVDEAKSRLRALQRGDSTARQTFVVHHAPYLPHELVVELERVDSEVIALARSINYHT
eukprot:PhM_4_TR5215/c0_g1_i1/m.103730